MPSKNKRAKGFRRLAATAESVTMTELRKHHGVDELTLMKTFLQEAITAAVEGVMEAMGVESAYYPIRVVMQELDSNFNPLKEHTILDLNPPFVCNFCGKPTNYTCIRDGTELHVCADCFVKACVKPKEE